MNIEKLKAAVRAAAPDGYVPVKHWIYADTAGAMEMAIARFFQTGRSPVDVNETIEIFEYMSAAQLSKERGGAEVPLAEVRR